MLFVYFCMQIEDDVHMLTICILGHITYVRAQASVRLQCARADLKCAHVVCDF